MHIHTHTYTHTHTHARTHAHTRTHTHTHTNTHTLLVHRRVCDETTLLVLGFVSSLLPGWNVAQDDNVALLGDLQVCVHVGC